MRSNDFYRNNVLKMETYFNTELSSKGEHSWEDTAEIHVRCMYNLDKLIKDFNMVKYLKSSGPKKAPNAPYSYYVFGFVPAGTADDFTSTLKQLYRSVVEPSTSMPEEKETDYTKLYLAFEQKYNPYPVQMSRCDAFTHALQDGIITESVFNKAREHYGSLWNYTGD